jgi:hypothetical protein
MKDAFNNSQLRQIEAAAKVCRTTAEEFIRMTCLNAVREVQTTGQLTIKAHTSHENHR